MNMLYILWSILGAVSCSPAYTTPESLSRGDIDVTTHGVSQDDVIVSRMNTLLTSLDALEDLSNQDLRAILADNYAINKLKAIANLLHDLTTDEYVTNPQITSRIASLLAHIGTVGYLIGMDMQLEESRRLSLQGITIYISKFEPSRFRGLYFSLGDESDAIAIPQSLTFPDSTTYVTSVSYSVSGVGQVLPGMLNNTIGNDVIATILLDSDGNDLMLTFNDPVLVNMKTGAVPEDKQPICGYLESGEWFTTDCYTVYPSTYSDDAVECRCNRLTIFGIVYENKAYRSHIGAAAMVGSGFTVLFCLITALVFIGYRLMHSVRCYIRFSFLTALALAEIMYLCIKYTEAPRPDGRAETDDDQHEHDVQVVQWPTQSPDINVIENVWAICTMVAAGSHFFSLASFTWLLSYSLFLGNDLIGQNEESLHVTHYTFLGWAIPLVVVLISYIWRYDDYVHHQYCWISDKHGLPYAFVLPICFIVVITLCVLLYDIAVYVSIKDPKKAPSLRVARSGLRSCCCLLPVLSTVWLLAHFMVNIGYLWLQVVFSVLNIILGVMLFLIMFCFNEEVLMKRNGKIFSLKKIWLKNPMNARKKNENQPSGSKPMAMTMIWRGFSKPSTSAEGQGSHPYVENVEMIPASNADVHSFDPEDPCSAGEGFDSPRHLTTLYSAPIASSEDSLLTKDSVDLPDPQPDNSDQEDTGRSSRMALLSEEKT